MRASLSLIVLMTGAAALLHCGRGFTVAKGPAPPVTSPADILGCDYNRAPLYELDGQGRYTTCGGLVAEVDCEFKLGFLAPLVDLPSGNVCERGVRSTRDITYNRERLLSARFWQETGCPMEGLHIGEDAELAAKYPVYEDGKTRFLVAGCGQERRYVCDGEGARASPFRCKEAPPRIQVLGEALREVSRAATATCRELRLHPLTRGVQPSEGLTELVLGGCGGLHPWVCELTPESLSPPAGSGKIGHGGRCALARPEPEALAWTERWIAQEYRRDGACDAAGGSPRVTAQPPVLDGPGVWYQTLTADGCRGAASYRCVASSFRDRKTSCTREPLFSAKDLQAAAFAAAGRLQAGCQLSEVQAKENQPTRTRLVVRGTCPMPGSGAPEPMEFPLVCARGAAPAGSSAPGPIACEVEAERWRHIQESRAFATANFSQDFRCAAGQIRVTDHQGESRIGQWSGYFRIVKVVGCGNNATYTCGKKERDGSPVTCSR